MAANQSSFVLLSAALHAGKQGKHSDSEMLFAKALGLSEKLAGKASTEYATMLVHFGDMCADYGRADKAELLYREALKIFESCRGADHLSTALVMRNLSDVCRRLNKNDEAEKWNFHAEEILIKHRIRG